jgi:hypothetical protein
MFVKKGKGPWAISLMGCGLSALLTTSAAHAALVTVSGVVTNNTATTQSYQFSQKIKVSEYIAAGQLGIYGTLSFTVSDFNRNGASIESDAGSLYSGWIQGTLAKSFMPLTTPSAFQLAAPARSMNSVTHTFASAAAPEMLAGRTLNPDDEIEVKLNFRLSAGDQAAYTGYFNVVPAPGVAALGLLAPWVQLHRRRRTENDR